MTTINKGPVNVTFSARPRIWVYFLVPVLAIWYRLTGKEPSNALLTWVAEKGFICDIREAKPENSKTDKEGIK